MTSLNHYVKNQKLLSESVNNQAEEVNLQIESDGDG